MIRADNSNDVYGVHRRALREVGMTDASKRRGRLIIRIAAETVTAQAVETTAK